MISVQGPLCLGMTKNAYEPAGTSVAPMVTSRPNVILVVAFAPARHTSPHGSSAPQIARPRTAGLE